MPIDVSYPIPLLEDILADAQPTSIIAEQSLTQYIAGRKLESTSIRVIAPKYTLGIIQKQIPGY